MTEKELAIKALEQMRGDDLYRAKAAFGGLTSKQLEENYGESGRTYVEILREYEDREQEINKAIHWLKTKTP